MSTEQENQHRNDAIACYKEIQEVLDRHGLDLHSDYGGEVLLGDYGFGDIEGFIKNERRRQRQAKKKKAVE